MIINNKSSYINSFLINKCSKEEYKRLKLRELTKEEKKSYLTNYYNKKLMRKNTKSIQKIISNKELFYSKYKKYIDYEYLVFKNFIEFKEFSNNKRIIANYRVYNVDKNNYLKIYEDLIMNKVNFITDYFELCREFKSISNNIPFIRFIIYKSEIITAYLFIPTKQSFIFAPINIETGIVDYVFTNYNQETYQVSPDTNESLLWFKIPKWPRVKRFAINVFTHLDGLTYASFDITITKDKPILLSGNVKPVIDYLQLPIQRNNNFGIMNKIKQIEKRK